jgi:tRNA/rRNA methyltransferase
MEYNDTFSVILVNPEDGANVGAVCRAMKTMGLTNLTIIGGTRLDPDRVNVVAVHAADIFSGSKRYRTLEEALCESALTAGFTRRTGKWRKYTSYSPEAFAQLTTSIGNGVVSLVFGNERTGLTDSDLNCCDCAVNIPTSPRFPSLNLSHAVQIALYVLFRTHDNLHPGKGPGLSEDEQKHYTEQGRGLTWSRFSDQTQKHPVTRDMLQAHVDSIISDLERIGFFSLTGKKDMSRFFRDIFARALLEKREAERMASIFHKLADLKIHRQ